MYQMGKKIRAWIDPSDIEVKARQQIFNTAMLEFISGLAVMGDCHWGRGATVGTVIATKSAIIPAAVGVDKGCGMIAVLTKFLAHQLPDNLVDLRLGVEKRIPMSKGGYQKEIQKSAEKRLQKLEEIAVVDYYKVDPKWRLQLGTLGGGNHFIEVCLDEQNRVWVVLHSGSRGIGNRLANYHIKVADRLMQIGNVHLPDRDLAYLNEGTLEFDAYIRDLLWAQEFARLNREEMMDQVMAEVSMFLCGETGHEKEIEVERINCHHNFTQREEHFGEMLWITRKGAIQMRQGQLGIIPGSMNSKTFIVSGLGNPDAYCSAPHGAGRKLSRGDAKKRFTEEDLRASMAGVEYRHSPALVDEHRDAYKDIRKVIADSAELVVVEHELKQILNVKGD